MTKIYFIDPATAVIGSIPNEFIAEFDLSDGASLLEQRYMLLNGSLFDKYAGIPDSQVVNRQAGTAPPTSSINPVVLKTRFTAEERIALYASTSPFVMDFLSILDDVRLTHVDKNNPSIVAGLEYLKTNGYISQASFDGALV